MALPHEKKVSLIKSLSPGQPMNRLNSRIALLLPGETFMERKRQLLHDMTFSRQYIQTMQRTVSEVPEVAQEIYAIIKSEQHQMRATFDELVALKAQVEKRARDEFQI